MNNDHDKLQSTNSTLLGTNSGAAYTTQSDNLIVHQINKTCYLRCGPTKFTSTIIVNDISMKTSCLFDNPNTSDSFHHRYVLKIFM